MNDPTTRGPESASPAIARDRPTRRKVLAGLGAALVALMACTAANPGGIRPPRRVAGRVPLHRVSPFLDDLERRTFSFFWDLADPVTGLIPDRWPSPSFSSVAAVGFGLTGYLVGVERGYVTRVQARDRVLTTLRFLASAPQGPSSRGMSGYRGFFYHFLDLRSGERYGQVELSTVDTAWLIAGVLACQQYFSDDDPAEQEVRGLAEELYRRVEWTWAQPSPPFVTMGWTPEEGFHPLGWHGYNEAMMLYLLALASPTFPVGEEVWPAYTSSYDWGSFHGFEQVGFGPLFGHQFTHCWVDFRGILDPVMRRHGVDYFENSRRATLAQRAYAVANPGGFSGYGEDVWGLSACDGPADVTLDFGGRPVRFFTYAARAASHTELRDDGTVAPYAAGASLPFAPEVVVPALEAMATRYGDHLLSTYGFLDAFNPTFTFDQPVFHGRVVPGVGWFDTDYLGIDQGPLLLMLENYRSELIWRLMRTNPHLIRGLRRAGFAGGWLEEATQ